jgi:hypothetical protein
MAPAEAGGWLIAGSAGQLHCTDCPAFELEQITFTLRGTLQNDGRELRARCIVGGGSNVAGDGRPCPVECLLKFLECLRIKDNTAAERHVVHDKTPVRVLGQQWQPLARPSTPAHERPQIFLSLSVTVCVTDFAPTKSRKPDASVIQIGEERARRGDR